MQTLATFKKNVWYGFWYSLELATVAQYASFSFNFVLYMKLSMAFYGYNHLTNQVANQVVVIFVCGKTGNSG